MLSSFSAVLSWHSRATFLVSFLVISPRGMRAVGELVLVEREQKIALVFAGIAPFFQKGARAVGAFLEAGEVAGGDIIGSELARAVDEHAELQFLIAHHAPLGYFPPVFRGKVLNDFAVKFPGFVHQIIRNAELVANAPRVGDRLGAAAFILGA